jgi:predicted PurR-regulated permease PerM
MWTAGARLVVFAAAVAALTVVLLALVWRALDVLLVVFAGILLAILLRGLATFVAAGTRLPVGLALAAVIVAILGLVAGAGWLLADDVAVQVEELVEQIPQAVAQVRQALSRYPWGRQIVAAVPEAGALVSREMLDRARGPLAATLGTGVALVTNVAILAFVGLYVAAAPEPYRRGILALVPLGRRARAAQVLQRIASVLRSWLVGKVVAMGIIGTLTAAGLWLIGVPLALTLGLLAGLTNFVPYLGPLLGFIPAVLLALLHSPTTALWVLALYVAVQTVESYVLTPLVQQRAVSLPPALTITAQVVLGVALGWLGLLLATPLTAVAVVLVQMLYVEDVLHDSPGRASPRGRPARVA